MTRIAWVLNLDADLELAAGPGYTPTKAVLGAMAPHVALLERMLVGPDDGVVGVVSGSEWTGRAFCPTPRALASMHAACIEPEPHPPFDVLRRVNSRAFCADLGQLLPGAVFARSLAEARAVVATAPPVGRQWRAKRAHGMAGRGQRPLAPGALSPADAQFIASSLERDGGIQLEPELALTRELAIHGLLEANGAAKLGHLVEQRCDATGQWLASVPLDEDAPTLRREAHRVATALHAAGYFGPFGLDAFEYQDGDLLVVNPRSEINARYSMGFAASGLLSAVNAL